MKKDRAYRRYIAEKIAKKRQLKTMLPIFWRHCVGSYRKNKENRHWLCRSEIREMNEEKLLKKYGKFKRFIIT